MRYARFSGVSALLSIGGWSPSGSSTRIDDALDGGRIGAIPRSVTITGRRVSSSMNASRSRGYSGSSDTYAPPALRIATIATTRCALRLSDTPAGTSGPTPRARSARASASARASSSRYVSRESPSITAIASGVRRACASMRSGTVRSLGYGAAVALKRAIRARSSGASTLTLPSFADGSAASDASTPSIAALRIAA